MISDLQWTIKEQFCFPSHLGVVREVHSCSVKANWQQQFLDASLQLLGIYHVKASISFTEGVSEVNGTLIEDFDFDEGIAYFEYAIPLKVDLPNKAYEKVAMSIKNEKVDITNSSAMSLQFDVHCLLQEQKSKPIQSKTEHNPKIIEVSLDKKQEEEVQAVTHILHELDFLANLPEDYNEISINAKSK